MDRLLVTALGRLGYADALAFQRETLAAVQAGGPQALLLCEHDPPVITLGKSARPEHILTARDQLAAEGVEVCVAGRGGQVAYHGPGQLMAYPIVRLGRGRPSVREYVHLLEGAVIDALAGLGVSAARRAGHPGVWVGEAKIAALGIGVWRWVAWHGVAVNVCGDLGGFGHIVLCGQPACPVTNISRQIGRDVTVADVSGRLTETLAEALGLQPEWSPSPTERS